MILTIYRSDCYLFHADGWTLMSWSDWSFDPISPGEYVCRPSGNRKVRDVPLPFTIKTPPLARRDGNRLMPSGDKFGVDAASAWYLAAAGERGFRIQEVARETAESFRG